MDTHLYLSVTPEALIASMLAPEDFGKYLSTGARRSASGPAIFMELDPATACEAYGLGDIKELCTPHEYGAPRRSSYQSIYRVLERLPVASVQALHLTTRKGVTMTLKPGPVPKDFPTGYFLYQELGPVGPRAVSRLTPPEFAAFMTSPDNAIGVPSLFFADMRLGQLAGAPVRGNADDLPYANIGHLRQCLEDLEQRPDKPAKVLNRDTVLTDLYQNVATGFYLGNGGKLTHFPMPDRDTLSSAHNSWWLSAKPWDRF